MLLYALKICSRNKIINKNLYKNYGSFINKLKADTNQIFMNRRINKPIVLFKIIKCYLIVKVNEYCNMRDLKSKDFEQNKTDTNIEVMANLI